MAEPADPIRLVDAAETTDPELRAELRAALADLPSVVRVRRIEAEVTSAVTAYAAQTGRSSASVRLIARWAMSFALAAAVGAGLYLAVRHVLNTPASDAEPPTEHP